MSDDCGCCHSDTMVDCCKDKLRADIERQQKCIDELYSAIAEHRDEIERLHIENKQLQEALTWWRSDDMRKRLRGET